MFKFIMVLMVGVAVLLLLIPEIDNLSEDDDDD